MRKFRILHFIPAFAAMAFPASTALAAEKEPAAAPAAAGLRLPRILGDHMVLQRDKPVKVWGWAEKGDSVSVAFAGQTTTATAAADGAWQVVLAPMPMSSQGRTLTVTSAREMMPAKKDCPTRMTTWETMTELSLRRQGTFYQDGKEAKFGERCPGWNEPREFRNLRWEGGE